MNKIVLGGVAALVVLGGAVWIARPDSGESSPPTVEGNGTLSVEGPNHYDFGTISMKAGKVKHQFTIKNTGSGTVSIEKLYTSCMCTTATLTKGDKRYGPYGMLGHGFIPTIREVLNSQEEAFIEVIFDPAAHGPAGVGRIQRVATLENSGQPVELSFVAVVTP